jgi:nucleotide-binding universal stress UspA family protein
MSTRSSHSAVAETGRAPRLRVREVLFPSDLSPGSEVAFEQARFLAERFEATLTLYHAVEVPDPSYAHWAFAHGHEIWCRAEQAARETLEGRARALGVSHTVVVERQASADAALLEFIRRTQPDLVVMATHGRAGLAHLVLGSVTERVVRHAFRPVLCLRPPACGGSPAYRRVLVPTDLSLASRLAFPMAGLFARTFGSELIALHVSPPAGATLSGVPNVIAPPDPAEVLAFCRDDLGDQPLRAVVQSGAVWERICKLAEAECADLIVMSTRGHDSLADRIIGSNTERVVRHAPCPVLVA